MSVEKQIQIAVAKTDLWICSFLKYAALTAVLLAFFLVCVYGFKHYMEIYHDPYWIDYDNDYFDMTSEGD